MSTNDPMNLRLVASNALNEVLISSSEATNGKTADSVCIAEFASTASLLYTLGDPAGARSAIDSVTLHGNTAIGRGIQTAINELTKPGADPTANRTGIIVFTDGTDNPSSGVNLTISEIQRAASLGIRVSFGFLTDSANQNRDVLASILSTGGIYATIDDASVQQAFTALILLNGLTGMDSSATGSSKPLLDGLATAAFTTQTGSNTFSYAAKAGEAFNITVTAIDPIGLKVTLRGGGNDIKSNTTSASGVASMQHTADSDADLEVVVTAANPSDSGIFSVGLRSALARSANCTLTTNTNITSTPNTTQPTNRTTSTISPPAQFTGGALAACHRSSGLFAALFSLTGYAIVAAVL